MTEMTPLSGKKIWSSGLSASTKICSRRQGACSRCNISLLRSRGGKASKSRLRGNLAKTFILSTRSRMCAGSKVVSLERIDRGDFPGRARSGKAQNEQMFSDWPLGQGFVDHRY